MNLMQPPVPTNDPPGIVRQPQTLWQVITGQPGTIYTTPLPPTPPRVPTILDYIEAELQRIHLEMENMRSDEYVRDNPSYHKLIDSLNLLNNEFVRRSQEESK